MKVAINPNNDKGDSCQWNICANLCVIILLIKDKLAKIDPPVIYKRATNIWHYSSIKNESICTKYDIKGGKSFWFRNQNSNNTSKSSFSKSSHAISDVCINRYAYIFLTILILLKLIFYFFFAISQMTLLMPRM